MSHSRDREQVLTPTYLRIYGCFTVIVAGIYGLVLVGEVARRLIGLPPDSDLRDLIGSTSLWGYLAVIQFLLARERDKS